MRSNSKGSKFERDICRNLSLWWSLGKDDDLFWRTSQSGGRSTSRAKKGKRTAGQHGDITGTVAEGSLLTDFVSIELKVGYTHNDIQELFDSNQSDHIVWKWIRQAKASAGQGNCPHWWLIWKRNKKKPLLFFDSEFWGFLHSRERSPFLIRDVDTIRIFLSHSDPGGSDLYICSFEDFKQAVDPTIFREMITTGQ